MIENWSVTRWKENDSIVKRENPNRLGASTSPYLLQHQFNVVDWYPWSDEAFERARTENKPVFLSIGYAACHWCHVMEHESFEDETIGEFLNRNFISIKVDREQRPDLDQIYMRAVQAMTGQGGWPMSVFLTAERKPFYGGTYWPPQPKWGRPGFLQILSAIIDAWLNRRQEIEQQCDELVSHIQSTFSSATDAGFAPHETYLFAAGDALARIFDSHYGGFGSAPKFPHATDLALLLRLEARRPDAQRQRVIEKTLDAMAFGGIYDHLAGGFARYSVDDQWLVPHFEKMLYDNGLLLGVYLDAYRWSKKGLYSDVVRQTADFLLTAMRHPDGGFYSSLDADSEGEEGKYYVWDRQEIFDCLGRGDGELFCDVYGVSLGGNFEGRNILHLTESIEDFARRRNLPFEEWKPRLDEMRRKLLKVRENRIPPGLDDKIIVSWNALVIESLARAAMVFDREDYLSAAQRCAHFLLQQLIHPSFGLLHVWRNGIAETDGFLDDHAFFANALLSLFEADQNPLWLRKAIELTETMLRDFSDDQGGFYYTSRSSDALISRPRDLQDQSIPSGSGMAALVLARLGHLVLDQSMLERSARVVQSAAEYVSRAPTAVGQMLIAMDCFLGPAEHWIVVGASRQQLSQWRRLRAADFHTNEFWVESETFQPPCSELTSLFEGRSSGNFTEPTMFCCIGETCRAPIIGEQLILDAISNRGP